MYSRKLISVYKSRTSTADCAPHYSWAHHTLPVTDVHVGKGGRRARVVTVSLDHSCRVRNHNFGYYGCNVYNNT